MHGGAQLGAGVVEAVASQLRPVVVVGVTGELVGQVRVGVTGGGPALHPQQRPRQRRGALRVVDRAVAPMGHLIEVQEDATAAGVHPDELPPLRRACLHEPGEGARRGTRLEQAAIQDLEPRRRKSRALDLELLAQQLARGLLRLAGAHPRLGVEPCPDDVSLDGSGADQARLDHHDLRAGSDHRRSAKVHDQLGARDGNAAIPLLETDVLHADAVDGSGGDDRQLVGAGEPESRAVGLQEGERPRLGGRGRGVGRDGVPRSRPYERSEAGDTRPRHLERSTRRRLHLPQRRLHPQAHVGARGVRRPGEQQHRDGEDDQDAQLAHLRLRSHSWPTADG